MKPSAIRIERMLEKIEAALVPPPRKCLRVIIHEGDDEAAAKEKALAEHIAAHPEDAGRTVKDANACGSSFTRETTRPRRRRRRWPSI